MLEKIIVNIQKTLEYLKVTFFINKIEDKKKKYRRKYDRDMENDEIEEFKFKLFIMYSLIICLPLIFTLIMFK